MFFKILTFITILISSVHANSSVSDFDLISYSPIKVGLKDLVCEVHLDGLTEQVKKQYVTVKVADEVFYKLYWIYPGKIYIDVEGIPRGFEQLKQSLVGLIVNRLDYLIPQDLAPRVRGYELKKVGSKHGGTSYEGVDPTNTKAATKIEIGFDSRGVLKRYKSYSPLGFQESTFDYAKKSWSKNKWVLEGVSAKMIQGPQVTESNTKIQYEKVSGYGLPKEISVHTSQKIVAPGEGEKKLERTGESKITFNNYVLNMGKAQKFFRAKESK